MGYDSDLHSLHGGVLYGPDCFLVWRWQIYAQRLAVDAEYKHSAVLLLTRKLSIQYFLQFDTVRHPPTDRQEVDTFP
jgi:hypothetical protein